MDLKNYLEPVAVKDVTGNLSKGITLGDYLKPQQHGVIDYDVALIGIKNDTNGTSNKGSAAAPDAIRAELYGLKGKFKNIYITDRGKFAGKTVKDIYFALEEVVTTLVQKKVIPVIIGGSQDFTLPVYHAIKACVKRVNVACIDQTLDANHNIDFDHRNYLKAILDDKTLRSFSLIGLQNYLYDETYLTAYPRFPQNTLRLGLLRRQIQYCEPVLRDANMVSFDMGAVRLSDAPGVAYGSPNGLFGEEACQLSRYAGFSDRNAIFSLFETNPGCDINRQTVKLASQIIWHFMDGLDKRYKDYPLRDIHSYKKYLVQQNDIDHELVFYNNPMNNRWWLEIIPDELIVSCTFEDYKYARSNKIPDIFHKWSK